MSYINIWFQGWTQLSDTQNFPSDKPDLGQPAIPKPHQKIKHQEIPLTQKQVNQQSLL